MTDGILRLPASTGGARVQRSIPAPHQRPRIAAGGAEAGRKRGWALIAAHKLKAGDIVPDIGRLYRVDEVALVPRAAGLDAQQVADGVSWTITVHGGLNNARTFQGGELVYAFTVEAG
jgi:hypothetical protein